MNDIENVLFFMFAFFAVMDLSSIKNSLKEIAEKIGKEKEGAK